MFEVWRTNVNKSRLVERIGTFERKIYASLVCDYMVQHGGDEYIVKEIKERTKELSLEENFRNKLKDLEKDFNFGKEKEHDYGYGFER